MKDEKTIYDDEMTNNQRQQSEKKCETLAANAEKNQEVPRKKPLWKKTAAGAGVGFVAGAAATFLTSATINGGDDEPEKPEDVQEWVDEETPVASVVNDDMSFAEAFSAARTELGPGGVFEWHGGIYGTYYESEWEAMSPAERAEFNSHFSWNNYHSDYVDSPNADYVMAEVDEPQENDVQEDMHVTAEIDDVTPNVEVLGVEYDNEIGGAVGELLIDGHEAVVVDVDGDMNFDIIGVDVNDNHQIEDNELADISDVGLSVDDLSAYAQDDTMLAQESVSDDVIDAEV